MFSDRKALPLQTVSTGKEDHPPRASCHKILIMKRFIQASYKLYDVTEGRHDLLEETQDGKPFVFITEMGIALDAFEQKIAALEAGQDFLFSLPAASAFGEHLDERVIDLDKSIFTVDGKFDSDHVQLGATLPLENADGNRFLAQVVAIGEKVVRVDLNHPLAGRDLSFEGKVLINRPATEEDIQAFNDSLHHHCHHGKDGGCGNCDGSCGNDGGCKDGGCHCGE